MLLQLSLFRPFTQLHPAHPLPPTFPAYSSCPWDILISSMASTFRHYIYPPPVYFPPIIYATYSLYLSPVSPPPNPLLITLHVISISVVLFLFQLFAQQTLQARRGWKEVFEVMKGKDLHPRLLYPAKLSLRMEGQIKCFSDKVKLKKFIITKPLLYEMLKGLI